jgi:plastocyanin
VKKLIALGVAGAVIAAAAVAVPAHGGATRTIRVDDNVFRPSSLTISRGDTLRFRWVGKAPHNVTRTSGPSFRRISNRKSGSVSRRIGRRGTLRLVCTIHPGMDMRVRVR